MTGFPLLAGFSPGAPIGWHEQRAVSWERFLGAALAFSERLPRGGYCVNLCDDRLNFMLAYAAALLAGCTSLLPQSRVPDALRELAQSYGGAIPIADQAVDEALWSQRATAAIPSIAADQQAAILFTSGSTGAPQAHAKSWRSLVAASQAARQGVRLDPGAALLVAVPPQHMWGFEMSVMLPMQSGCAVHPACPLLPGEIVETLAKLPAPRWLVATPLHLRACLAADVRLPVLAGALCATAELPRELAAAVEDAWSAPLYEIYGSTETGAMALRRPAQRETFETLGGIRVRATEGAAIASGGQLDAPVALNDVLELESASAFALRGRTADLVKIGGKRASLAALNLELGRAPGVTDCAYMLRDTGHGEPRLCAFVVAQGGGVAPILEHLRNRVDPVFLPRPLVIVDALPRNRAGKITRENLEALAAHHGLAPAASAVARWQQVEPSHPALPFHFPGDPIVPGVWLLSLVEKAVRDRYGEAMTVRSVPDASFRNILRPGESFRIELEQTAPGRIAFRVESQVQRIADGTLIVAEAA